MNPKVDGTCGLSREIIQLKGLVDAGLAKLPRLFVHHHLNLQTKSVPPLADVKIPVIDFAGANTDYTQRTEIIDRIRSACEEWGFFQLVNHGIPVTTLEEMTSALACA